MEVTKLIEVLRATLDPNQREEAEHQLTEVCYIFRVWSDSSVWKFLLETPFLVCIPLYFTLLLVDVKLIYFNCSVYYIYLVTLVSPSLILSFNMVNRV